MKSRLAVSKALYLKPIIFGLDRSDSPFELIEDYPANNSIKLKKRSENIRNAFLSPIDYARHGGEYRIVPNICVSSKSKTNSIQLYINPDAQKIESVAADIRYSSEIILAKIVLEEKYRNHVSEKNLTIVPITQDYKSVERKVDAILVVNDYPIIQNNIYGYCIDLVEDWEDITNLPYVHGFWTGCEEETSAIEIMTLLNAKKNGTALIDKIAEGCANKYNITLDDTKKYFSDFSYDFNNDEQGSLFEFIQYAYYHGIIGDIPEIKFFDIDTDKILEN